MKINIRYVRYALIPMGIYVLLIFIGVFLKSRITVFDVIEGKEPSFFESAFIRISEWLQCPFSIDDRVDAQDRLMSIIGNGLIWSAVIMGLVYVIARYIKSRKLPTLPTDSE